MLKKTIHLFLLLFITSVSYAQTQEQIIVTKKSLWKYKFEYAGKELNTKSIKTIISNDLEANLYLKKAIKKKETANIINGLAGLGLIYALMSDVTGGDKVWGIAGLGSLALIGISIPLYADYHKYTRIAAEIYNSNIAHQKSNLSIAIGANASGLGIALRF